MPLALGGRSVLLSCASVLDDDSLTSMRHSIEARYHISLKLIRACPHEQALDSQLVLPSYAMKAGHARVGALLPTGGVPGN